MNEIDFLGENAFRIIELLLEKKQYLRELAERTGLAPSSVHKIISKLVLKKIAFFEKQKNRKVFSLNYDSALTTSAIKILFVNKIISAKAFKKLVALKPIGIYLFGTAASGKITSNSDIDLAINFSKKPDSLLVSNIKRELSNELRKEIQLIILTKDKIVSMKKENAELLSQIKNKSIVLMGEAIE